MNSWIFWKRVFQLWNGVTEDLSFSFLKLKTRWKKGVKYLYRELQNRLSWLWNSCSSIWQLKLTLFLPDYFQTSWKLTIFAGFCYFGVFFTGPCVAFAVFAVDVREKEREEGETARERVMAGWRGDVESASVAHPHTLSLLHFHPHSTLSHHSIHLFLSLSLSLSIPDKVSMPLFLFALTLRWFNRATFAAFWKKIKRAVTQWYFSSWNIFSICSFPIFCS